MLDAVLFALTLVAALGCGLIAGVFFAFSAFLMPALSRLPPAGGIAAMQAVNVAAVTPPFMAALFGTALACLALAAAALLDRSDAATPYRLAGAALYLLGTILVTVAFNVPRNDALAAVAPDSPDGAALWTRYVPAWTAWNTVRAAAALAAAAALSLALVAG